MGSDMAPGHRIVRGWEICLFRRQRKDRGLESGRQSRGFGFLDFLRNCLTSHHQDPRLYLQGTILKPGRGILD